MSYQSPKPLPTPLAMSSASNEPSPSPLPVRVSSLQSPPPPIASRPHPKPTFPTPKLRLKIQDLNHPGAHVFTSNSNISTALSAAVESVLAILYRSNVSIPPTRSVTLILRSMPGVAYTTGSTLDEDHKEIHFSLDYISNISSKRQHDEIQGVLVHEMVHCWQWNALGTAPGGLIEGIADYVRLKADLSPPHWRRESGGDWDAGYQHTGYFLEWLEVKYGEVSVMRINENLRETKYLEKVFWEKLFGKGVKELWKDYSTHMTAEEKTEELEVKEEEPKDDDVVLVDREDGSKEVQDQGNATGIWLAT